MDPLEWGVIILMGAGILIYGPDKIPEIAKTLATVRKQVDGATKQLQGITKELQTGLNTGNLNMDTLSKALLDAGGAGAATAGATAGQPAGAPVSPAPTVTAESEVVAPPAPPKSSDQMLIEMARILKIDTRGKTKDEITQAITDAVSNRPPETASPATSPAEPAPEAKSAEQPPPAQVQPENAPVPAGTDAS